MLIFVNSPGFHVQYRVFLIAIVSCTLCSLPLMLVNYVVDILFCLILHLQFSSPFISLTNEYSSHMPFNFAFIFTV